MITLIAIIAASCLILGLLLWVYIILSNQMDKLSDHHRKDSLQLKELLDSLKGYVFSLEDIVKSHRDITDLQKKKVDLLKEKYDGYMGIIGDRIADLEADIKGKRITDGKQ